MAEQRIPVSSAEILSQRTHIVPGQLAITEHLFRVPLDYSNPSSGEIQLFARSARPARNADPSLPWVLWLTGGPGQSCMSPEDYPFTSIFLERGYQLLALDHRGTGRSTPVCASTLAQQGDAKTQAQWLSSFRADSIVRDCEALRYALDPEGKPWTLLAHSFGGYVAVTYLSFYPQGVCEAFLTGGLLPLVDGPDEVGRALCKVVQRRNQAYYDKYPEDHERVWRVLKHLVREEVRTPDSGTLSANRFLFLGMDFGMHGKFDAIHDLVLRAALDLDTFGYLTRPTLGLIAQATDLDEQPLFFLLYEAMYCNGTASNWSYARLMSEFPSFSSLEDLNALANTTAPPIEPINFFGEMTFPWMLDDYVDLAKKRDVAQLLAQHSEWPPLFDTEQLAMNEVPVWAAAFNDDMYVSYEFSLKTAAAIKKCKLFTTNIWYHNAINGKCKELLDQLFALRDDAID
ncbi:alpha/beta-hydrolase [Myriangium duriaei CBS 260.36]|uniref:Alpha/beta-hydrolase n=1 Tax=Myriangium duriaei CBS 260.36 TaxID=1168546 RepID=A0A9P4MHS6_9PEZI|nr:alpha/beta-hydrolase [Myriangium duriaei CBS 260.36]